MDIHRSDGAHHCRQAITTLDASRRGREGADGALLPDALPFTAGEMCTGGEGLCSGGGAIEKVAARDEEGRLS